MKTIVALGSTALFFGFATFAIIGTAVALKVSVDYAMVVMISAYVSGVACIALTVGMLVAIFGSDNN